MKTKRLIHLECARGLASFIVLFHHFSLAFHPGVKVPFWRGGLKLTPFYFLMNGSGAVTFFFVLSGFALTLGLFRRPSFSLLAVAVLKRLPRLMIPAAVSIFLGLTILLYAGSPYLAASAYNGSLWLSSFGEVSFPTDFIPSIADATRQSLWVFLFQNNYYYNSNLWTMVNEFYGSMLVFGIVLVFGFEPFRRSAVVAALHGGLAIVCAVLYAPFVPFVAGSFLAYRVTRPNGEFEVSNRLTWILLAGAVMGFSFDWWVANTLAAVFVMTVLLGNRSAAALLSGPVGALAGKISFPIYLVHTLVILSVSSLFYAHLSVAGWPSPVVLPLTMVVTLLASGIVCSPLILLDSYWVSWLNLQVKTMVDSVAEAYSRRRVGALVGRDR